MLRRLWVLAALVLTAGACAEHKGPPMHVVLAHGAVNDRCVPVPVTLPRIPDEVLNPTSLSRLRVSVRSHGTNDVPGSFLCDTLLDVPRDQPFLKLDVKGIKTVDFLVEGFLKDPTLAAQGGYKRVATGSLLNIDVKATAIDPLRLYPSQSFRCVDSRLKTARAFHTATLLPDGSVLIVGGVVASPDDNQDTVAGDVLYVTGSAEIYDPKSGTFKTVMEAPPAPRAFHGAALLDGEPPYRVLLVGGLAATDPTQPSLGTHLKPGDGARLVPIDPTGTTGKPLTTRAVAAEILTYDPVTGMGSRAPVDGFKATTFAATVALKNGIAVAGGVDYGPAASTDTSNSSVITVQLGGAGGQVGALAAQRIGGALVPLYDDFALLWGGVRMPTVMPPAAAIGEFVSNLSGAPTSTAIKMPVGPLVQFPTATRFASDGATASASVLVTGGFVVVGNGVALQPPVGASGLAVVTVQSGVVSTAAPQLMAPYVADTMCRDPARYRPAGWESAVLLPNGKVLVTGGSPIFDVGTGCNDCEDGQTPGLLCSLHQSSLFSPPSTLAKIEMDGLQIGRFGHTSTVLHDGTVLVVGGLSLPTDGTPNRTVGDAEIYDPRSAAPPYDPAQPAANDPDDPLFKDISDLKLTRAPGEQARDPAQSGALAKPCPDL